MEFKQQYAAYQQAIEEYLNGIFTADKPYGRLQEAMRYSILGGGKRIRPVLTLEFARLGGIDWHLALPYACALELVHNYSLICAGASPPPTKSSARLWRCWREMHSSRRPSA